ncbi:MAG: hypothetical protein ACYCXR_07790 [Coriobacteriia bacterium]
MKRTLIIAVSVVALVFGVMSYATAVTGDTTVNATVANVLEISAPAAATLGELTPDVSKNVSVVVTGKSNKPATLSASVAKGTFTSLTSTVDTTDVLNLRGGNISHSDTVTGLVDYFVNPDLAVSGTITYSLVQ